jgi:DNA-binding CsgD family transcriptional regulator
MSYAVEALAASPMVRAVDATGLSLLSKRELEVVRSLAEGLTNREIGERLGLSQHTIKNYLFRVYDKLGVSSRLELLFMTMAPTVAPRSTEQTAQDSSSNGNERPRLARSGPIAKDALSQPSGAPEPPKLGFPASSFSQQETKGERQNEEPWEAKSKV